MRPKPRSQVVHIGDSTSIGLMSSAYQPNKENWVDAQYRKVGDSSRCRA
jgi:hypothetical protein